MTVSFPPGLIVVLAGLLLPFVKGKVREAVVLVAPLLALAAVWMVPDGPVTTFGFLDYELTVVQGSTLGRVFGTVFTIMAFAGGLFALRQARLLELASAFVYAGSAVAVTTAGDLITIFVFWEVMAIGSTLVLWASDQPGARAASMRYLLVHLLGGVILMFGIGHHVAETGSIALGRFTPDSVGRWAMLIGFLINAGAPPLGAWIGDAYPEASPSGMVFLSAYTTKTAVYALIVTFAGASVLIPIGLYMVFYGIIYALLENDMRRILAYSIVNQVGFMVTGIGIGTEMALNGAASHAFAHIIYKALLLMSAGSVLRQTGKRLCTDLGGLFRTMPLTTICGTVGALAISSFPWTSGFVTKSMIASGAGYKEMTAVWMLLEAASAGVFLHAGIKFPWFVFFQKDSGLRPKDPPFFMSAPMVLFAAACIVIGLFPQPLYDILPFPVEYVPYTVEHVVAQLQLLLFAGLAFFVLLPLMKRTLTISLDFDWFYRRLGVMVTREFATATGQARDRAEDTLKNRAKKTVDGLFRHHGPRGILARTWPTGSMVLWVAILLAAFLLYF